MSDSFNLSAVGKNARSAASNLSEISDEVISETLVLFSTLIQKNKAKILEANDKDIELALQEPQ